LEAADEIVVLEAADEIVALEEAEEVIASEAVEEIVALETAEEIVALEAEEEIVAMETTEGIVAVGTTTEIVVVIASPPILAITPMYGITSTAIGMPEERAGIMVEAAVLSRWGSGVLLQAASFGNTDVVSPAVVDRILGTNNAAMAVGTTTTVYTGRPSTGDGWARDARMVEGIFQIMEGMEPPWITINVLDAAVVRFPTVDREILRLAIMTMMMTQRRCVVRLTRAGLRLRPRIDREGNPFLELDLDYADRYSTSN